MERQHDSRGAGFLVVEDDPDTERLILRALRSFSADVLVARDGEEALKVLDGCNERDLPSFVLLDIRLPKLDGMQVLQWIRSHALLAPLPVVLFSSSDETGDILRGMELGASSYVQKPTDYQEFMDVVQLVAEYWFRHNVFVNGNGRR